MKHNSGFTYTKEDSSLFPEMRRHAQALSEDECFELLDHAKVGTLALLGDNDYPYAIPLNFGREGTTLYFHSASSGHKIRSLKRNEKASFSVIGKDLVVPKEYTSYFSSVIAFGRVRILTAPEEKLHALRVLTYKYVPETDASREETKKGALRTTLLAFDIDYMSGKQAKELIHPSN
ncbi:MAG: pyridoxamine 5'-phosphate oxidase family protein [Eggerthellaceae bacterium]|nr:pyridoxamine 5'-phosphate oxidase family protein [Eggerthellaceae bacterium]